MKNTVIFQESSHPLGRGDVKNLVESLNHAALVFEFDGTPRSRSPWGFFTTFPLLPGTSQGAANDKFLVSIGTGTEIVAQSAKGGVNVKTQASTPADNDNAMLATVANTAGVNPITPVSRLRFATRVNLTQISELVFGAGFDENLTSPIGSATAGEGAQFLFDPDDELGTDMVAENWILAQKVNGVDTYQDSGIAVVGGKDYELAIEIGEDLKPVYYIDGVKVGTGTAALTENDSVGVVIGVQINAAAPSGQKDFDCRYVSVERRIG